MLRIEIDVFSGRPNPVWLLTDEAETKRLIGAIAEAKGVLAKPGAGFTGLGLREVRVGFRRTTRRVRGACRSPSRSRRPPART